MSAKNRTAAPALTASIVYQFERALLQLASAPSGSAVGLEVLDDLAQYDEASGDIIFLEQDKHSVSEHGYQLNDKSEAIWNTLKNWLRIHGERSNRIHKYLFVTNSKVVDGFLWRLGKASKTNEEVSALVKEIRSYAIAADASERTGGEGLIAEVQSYDDAALSDVIRRLELIDASSSGDPSAVYSELEQRLLLPADVKGEYVIDKLSGWLQRVAVEKWRARKPAWITRRAFVEALKSVQDTYRRQKRKRERAAISIPITAEEIDNESSSPFVHQLIDIDATEMAIEQAIADYLQFSKEKFRLIEEGIVTADDFADRSLELEGRWQRICTRYSRALRSTNHEDVGNNVYNETIDFKSDLAGEATFESYLTSGHYQRLANEQLVVWHPRYWPRSSAKKRA